MTETGTWERKGPYELLVDRNSAIQADSDPGNCFPINEDHSDMVKFADDSSEYRVVIGFLNTLIQVAPTNPIHSPGSELPGPRKSQPSVVSSRLGRAKGQKLFSNRASIPIIGSSCTWSTCAPPVFGSQFLLAMELGPQAQSNPSKQTGRKGRKRAENVGLSSPKTTAEYEDMEKQKNLKGRRAF